MRRIHLKCQSIVRACIASQHRSAITESYGQITDEDRRWWKLHIEAHPDVTLGTFTAFLDNCDVHAQKRLIEKDIWTIEQVSAMTEDDVEQLKYREGCLKMDIIWEHARAIAPELRRREYGEQGSEDAMATRLLEIRKKRELEKRKQEILQSRNTEVSARDERIKLMKDEIQKRRNELRQKQQERQKGRDIAGPSRKSASQMTVTEAMESIKQNMQK